MPVYDHECRACGPFTVLRPMAQCQDPHDCPGCGEAAPRAFLTAPAIAGLDAAARRAHATNERSRHAPRRSASHGPGCGCCTPKRPGAGATGDLAKSFPGSRPWMISH